MVKIADRFELWPITDLVPYERNSRVHEPAQIEGIAASIAEFGFLAPIIVDRTQHRIAAGVGRLLAAKRLGLERVPVVAVDHLTPAQFRAYVIADNRHTDTSYFDEDVLVAELAELRLEGFDLAPIGFNADELVGLLADGHGAAAATLHGDADVAPEPTSMVVSRRGDLWKLGPHRVLCGDATDASDYAALLGDERAAMCFTDPPYNVDYADNPKDKLRGKHRPILNDALDDSAFEAFLQAACRQLLAVTDGAVYIAMSSSELDTLQRAFRAAGGHWSTFVIWAKHAFTMGRADYQRQYEPILYGWREGATHHWCGARGQGDVWFIDKPARNDLHPTMKPVALVDRALRNSSRPGDIVIDPFGGSGTTLMACEVSGRHARLMELDSLYVDVIVRRWQAWAGAQAIRASDGLSFDAVATAA